MNGEIQTIKLKDGRRLAFVEYGDPKGKPLMYFHGWPASHLSAAKYDALAKKMHIRVIAPDRSGYGLSDFKKGRTILDWPRDVVELANFLKIQKFAVLGVSGGGPYAAVCGYAIPKRLTNVGIAVGLSPIIGPHMFDGMMWMSRVGWMTYGKAPVVRFLAAWIQYINSRWGPTWGIYGHLFGAKADKKFYEDRETRLATKEIFREAFRQGWRGPELDLKLYTTDWGFEVGAITSKTYLWYGASDQNVSLNMGKYYANHIKGSKLTVFAGGGHMISVTHAPEIFKTLIQ